MAGAIIVPTKFTAIDKVSMAIKKMSRATTAFSRTAKANFARVQRAERRLRKNLMKPFGMFGVTLGFMMLFRVVGGVIGIFSDFEQANAGVAAVLSSATGPELKALRQDAMRLGAVTAKTATEVVGLQEAFGRLGFSAGEIIDMTQATISGSVAMKGELSDTAELVGAVVKTFDGFSSITAPKIIDQMTLSTQKSALNFEKLQTALPIVGGAANAAGLSFTETLALLGKLSDAGIDASSSANALKRIFIESKKNGDDYTQVLERIVKNSDKLTTSVDEFGVRASVSGVILSKNILATKTLDNVLKSASGTAKTAADIQLNTLQGRLTLLKSAWEGYILSVEDGTGKFAGFLNKVVTVATEILALASGTAVATSELDSNGVAVRNTAKKVLKFIKILKWAIITMVTLKGIMIIFKGVMMAWRIAVTLVTAAQWLWNIAMTANPIGIIIVAVGALIALVVLMIKNWDTWGKQLFDLILPIQAIIDEWGKVKEAFSEKGILGGIEQIGKSITNLILWPVRQVVRLLEMIGVLKEGSAQRFTEYTEAGSLKTTEIASTLLDKKLSKLNADANVTGVDLIETKKSILEIYNKTPNKMELFSDDEYINLTQNLGWEQ